MRSGERSIPIEAETLDRLFPTERIGVLKLDLEGAERAALEGAERLLKEGRIVERGPTSDVVALEPIRAAYGVRLVENARIGFELEVEPAEDTSA